MPLRQLAEYRIGAQAAIDQEHPGMEPEIRNFVDQFPVALPRPGE